jgi:hypothetical protein
MTGPKPPARPAPLHECPVCHFPQTMIQRKLSEGRYGATNYVCARAAECPLGINLAKVDTWIVR